MRLTQEIESADARVSIYGDKLLNYVADTRFKSHLKFSFSRYPAAQTRIGSYRASNRNINRGVQKIYAFVNKSVARLKINTRRHFGSF